MIKNKKDKVNDLQVNLTKKPIGVTLIEAFPGFGLVGVIASEFLIEHLNAEKIGRVWSDQLQPMVAVHGSEVIEPIGIYYDPKTKIAILHVHPFASLTGIEWKLADIIGNLAKDLKVKEVISLEGVGAFGKAKDINAYYYSKDKKRWGKTGVEELKEGIIMGVTGALLLNLKDVPFSCIFAETHSGLPDSRAAAKVIEVLDKYLGLNVDYKPLLKKAEELENKVKDILSQTKQATDMKEQKEEMNYVG